MELDLLYEVDVPKPWNGGQRAAEVRAFDHCIEEVKLADKMGFRTVWCVEHHFREQRSHLSAPEVLIGALSQVTENIRLGFGVVLMPHRFSHPIRVAEKVATADILSHGRVEWGTGRSTPMEQAGFGVPPGEGNRGQWREAIETVVAAWESEGDSFSWNSENLEFPARPEHHPTRSIVPKPQQLPHPPAWSAAVSTKSAEVVGESGLGLLSFSIMQPLSAMAEQIEVYRAAQERAKPITKVHTNRVAAYTLVHCAESAEEVTANGAWDAVWWWYQNIAETALEWDFRELPQEDKDKMFPILKKQADGEFDVQDFNDSDMVIIGDVDSCVEKIARYAALGVDQLICYSSFGGLDHEAVMRSIELLGTKVMPELERRGIDVTAALPDTALASSLAPTSAFFAESGVKFTPGGISGVDNREDDE